MSNIFFNMRFRNKYRKKYQMQVRISTFRKILQKKFLARTSVTCKIQFAMLCKYSQTTNTLISKCPR